MNPDEIEKREIHEALPIILEKLGIPEEEEIWKQILEAISNGEESGRISIVEARPGEVDDVLLIEKTCGDAIVCGIPFDLTLMRERSGSTMICRYRIALIAPKRPPEASMKRGNVYHVPFGSFAVHLEPL